MKPGRRNPVAPLPAFQGRIAARFAAALVCGSLCFCQLALGQFGPTSAQVEEQPAENVFLPAPRPILQRLSAARELLAARRFGEAVRYLGTILNAEEDFFFQPDRDEPIHRSLKVEAQRLIGAMPAGGRDLYELQYGPLARNMLSEAVEEGDVALLAELSRRFFHTEAGYEGTFLLAMHHFNHGRPLAAGLTFDRLHDAVEQAKRFQPALSLAAATAWLQAGSTDRATELLVELKEARRGRPLRIGGRDVPWFAAREEATGWLAGYAGPLVGPGPSEAEQWTMVRGNPSRNATAPGGPPLLNIRWEVPVADDPLVDRLLAQQQQLHQEQGVPPVPELHPLVVDEVVLMRTTRNLLAVDIHTGKRLWEVPVDDPLESLLQASPTDGVLQAQQQQLPFAVRERVLQDRTFGSLSSDGEHVYAIEDLTPSTGFAHTRQVVRGAVRVMPGQPPAYNRLTAHDIRTGKLKWHLGGPEDEYALRLAETFFLGPPLPLRGQLFVLAEIKEEIRLLALEASTGELLWAQSLAIVEQEIAQSPLRRLAGLSPSYADGILVCPTSAGAVVAVDLATRSLLWGYRYGQSAGSRHRGPFFAMQFGVAMRTQSPTLRWVDANPMVVDGRVLLTPVESDLLHCLDLADGQPRWSAAREDDLYVACVHEGKVVLVGRNGVRALALDDGKPAWEGRVLEFPDGGMPSGHGIYTGKQYLLPLSTAEIVAIDLDRGRTAHVARSRQGQVPGNLVAYEGFILSQGARGLAAFHQIDVLRDEVARRLAQDPADAEALALRGELLLDEGKRDEAIDHLARSHELAIDQRTVDLLRDAFLDGLRNDFDAYLVRVEEIEPLLRQPREEAEFIRVMADGFQQAGRWSKAFEHYLKLVELDEESRRLESVDKTLSVRGDRWIRARLTSLRADAEGDEAAEIERLIAARMRNAVDAGTVSALTRFLDYFGHDSSTDPARDALVRSLIDAGKLLEVELALWSDRRDAETASGAAEARIAKLLDEVGQEAEAARAYRHLVERYADVECLDGRTGRQLVEALPEERAAPLLADAGSEWPQGRIDVQDIAANRPPTQGRFPLDFRGDPGPFFRDTIIRLDQTRRSISATDGQGRVRWTLPLVEPGSQHSFPFNPSTTYARACGHLLVISLGHRIVAVDALGQRGRGQVRILWSQDLTQGGFDQSVIQLNPQGGVQLAQAFVVGAHGGQQSGSLGPVTPRYVCFQHYRNVIAVEPVSGETLWVRHGVPPDSTLFGDDEYVLVASPESSEVLVLDAVDGSQVGQRPLASPERFDDAPAQPLPAAQRRFAQTVMTTIGRNIVVSFVHPADGRQVIGLFDPLEQEYVWGPMRAAVGKTAHVGEELIGLLGPDGRLQLVRMEDGRVLFDAKLPGEADAAEMHLLRSGGQYLVVTNRPRARNAAQRNNPLPGTLGRSIDDGRVYAFDLDGTPLWPEPAVVESQWLVFHQPEDLPILVFAGQVYDPQKAGADRFTAEVVCVDKRSGQVFYRGSFPGPTGTFEIVGDPDTHSIEIQLQRNVVKLTLTDEPVPPEEPEAEETEETEEAEAPADEPPLNPSAALLRAFGGAIMKVGSSSEGQRRNPPQPTAKPREAEVER